MKIKTLTVSEVNNYIKRILDNDFILNNLSVKGEISNLKHHCSGHVYFSLKDDLGKINCVMFKSKAMGMSFNLEDGMEVVIKGRASVYTANGTFQLYCDEIEKQGVGDLYKKFEALKNRLSKEGYFDEEFKKSIPQEINRVGVVTSDTGAAIQDIKNVIRRRNKIIDIVLFPAVVQGKNAYKTVIEGIEYFNSKKNVDIIIIGRGGGSLEELWNFNEEELAISIFKSKIPIISAVGHEIDYTISDFVSDVRAATPSQAAELVAVMQIDLLNKANSIEDRLNNIINNKLITEKDKLGYYDKILRLNSPQNRIANGYMEIEIIKDKITDIIQNKLKQEKEKIFSLNNVLQANNPVNILGKGYGIIEGDDNKVYNSIKEFNEEQKIKILLKDGYVKGDFTLVEKGGERIG